MSHEWDPKNFNRNLLGVKKRRMLYSVLLVERNIKRDMHKITAHLASTVTHEILINQGNVRGFNIAGGTAFDGTIVDYAIHEELGTKFRPGHFRMRHGLRRSYPGIRRIWGIR